jgi:hypothetical protein
MQMGSYGELPNGLWMIGASMSVGGQVIPAPGVMIGAIFGSRVTDPTGVGPERGQFFMVQTVTDRGYVINNEDNVFVRHDFLPPNANTGLDGGYPYGFSPPVADFLPALSTVTGGFRNLGIFQDTPGVLFSPKNVRVEFDADFAVYVMYTPPANSVGESYSVPLQGYFWKARRWVYRTNPTTPWIYGIPDDSGGRPPASVSYPAHPVWVRLIA